MMAEVSDCIQTGHQSCHRFEAYSKTSLVPNVDVLSALCETDQALQVVGMIQVSAAAHSTRCPAVSFVVFEHLIYGSVNDKSKVRCATHCTGACVAHCG
jgi:hypothetical protein